MKLLLDTSGYVGFKLGHKELVTYLARAERIFMSPIVLGELMFGFRNGSRYEKNMDELHRFVSHPVVEPIDLTAISADRYARIAAQLRKQGTPIPANDIWIAAQTVEVGAELITMDQHFEKVQGLVYRLFHTATE